MAAASTAAKAPEPAPDLPLPPNAGPSPDAIAALDAAISQAFPSFGDLTPDTDNQITRGGPPVRYLSAPKLLAAVRPALAAQGVGITSCLRPTDRGLLVTTSVVHAGGGWRSSDWPVINTRDDRSVAVSAGWGLRQNLLQLLALSPGDAAPEQQAPPAAAPPAGPPMLPGEPPAWMPPAPAAAPAWAGGPVSPAPAPNTPQDFI